MTHFEAGLDEKVLGYYCAQDYEKNNSDNGDGPGDMERDTDDLCRPVGGLI